MADPDVLVIGAGAAGIAAARTLAASGTATRVIEARNRIGGRAFTAVHAGFPLDLGCGWLHSADENELSGIAIERGFTINKSRPPWGAQIDAVGFPPQDRAEFGAAMGAFFACLDCAGAAIAAGSEPDRPGATCLEPDSRWNPMLNAISTYINGVELDRVSMLDFWNYRDTETNWRIAEGYGSLIAALGEGLDIVLDCPASLIDHGGTKIRVATARGDFFARAVIIAVPTNVLASGGLALDPALPEKVEAATVLPLGLADKLFLRLDDAEEFAADSRLFGARDRAETGAYHIRPFGRPLVEGYFGGRCARNLEEAGEGAFAAFAIEQFASVLGSAIRKRLHPIGVSAWARDPYALGSYSYALPGSAPSRAVLAAPVDNRLFFAGEACSIHDFSTAHGAYRTGIAAAQAVTAALRVPHASV